MPYMNATPSLRQLKRRVAGQPAFTGNRAQVVAEHPTRARIQRERERLWCAGQTARVVHRHQRGVLIGRQHRLLSLCQQHHRCQQDKHEHLQKRHVSLFYIFFFLSHSLECPQSHNAAIAISKIEYRKQPKRRRSPELQAAKSSGKRLARQVGIDCGSHTPTIKRCNNNSDVTNTNAKIAEHVAHHADVVHFQDDVSLLTRSS
jgi:hypothetical protein